MDLLQKNNPPTWHDRVTDLLVWALGHLPWLGAALLTVLLVTNFILAVNDTERLVTMAPEAAKAYLVTLGMPAQGDVACHAGLFAVMCDAVTFHGPVRLVCGEACHLTHP